VEKGQAEADWSEARERSLIERAQRGDERALAELLDRFAQPLYSAVILPGVGHRADAEDILRETLAAAAERIGDFRPREGAGIWGWLRRIATNRIIDRSRRLAAQRRMTDAYEAEVQVLPPRVEIGAEAALIEREERAAQEKQLSRALGALNERHRRAIELRVIEERPREECAAEMGVSVGAFDVLLHRAMAALKKAWHAG
jgi:RNA polymerase sigma-70 factor (ECF subfamily)